MSTCMLYFKQRQVDRKGGRKGAQRQVHNDDVRQVHNMDDDVRQVNNMDDDDVHNDNVHDVICTMMMMMMCIIMIIPTKQLRVLQFLFRQCSVSWGRMCEDACVKTHCINTATYGAANNHTDSLTDACAAEKNPLLTDPWLTHDCRSPIADTPIIHTPIADTQPS